LSFWLIENRIDKETEKGKMKKIDTGMEAMINATKTCWNRLENSLAGWIQCVCTSCGTTLVGEERSLFERGLPKVSYAMAHRDRGVGISVLSGLFSTPLLLLFLLTILGTENSANADPIMDVSYSAEIADYDFNPNNGLEKNNYLVKNISPENIQDNNLIEFLLPGGSTQGVIYASSQDSGWDIQILENQTKFTGNGEFIPVGQQNRFYTYVSENQQMGLGFAEALAKGDDNPINFDPVETTVAIPEPAVVTIIGFSTILLLLIKRIFE
jgi:hypothetical protein